MISRRKISSTKSVEKMALWRRKTRAWGQIILGLTLFVIFNTQPSSRLYAWYMVYVHVYSTVAEGGTCSKDTKPRIFTISGKVSKYLIKRGERGKFKSTKTVLILTKSQMKTPDKNQCMKKSHEISLFPSNTCLLGHGHQLGVRNSCHKGSILPVLKCLSTSRYISPETAETIQVGKQLVIKSQEIPEGKGGNVPSM